MKILIIDDDEALVSVWKNSFEKEGFEVFHVTTGKDGFEEAKKLMPDFILLDQIMPDIEGNDVLRLLKEDPQTTAIPVAMSSNYSEKDHMEKAIQQGAADYILKYQVEVEDLINKIKTLTRAPQ